MLKMSRGLGSVMLQFPSHLNVTDKKWHQLEVRTNGQVSYLIFSFRILAFTYADIQEDREKRLDNSMYYSNHPCRFYE